MRYADGLIELVADDVVVPGGGFFGHTRSYGNSHRTGAFPGVNGYNWWVQQSPYVAQVDATTVQVAFSVEEVYWFYKSGATYTAAYGTLRVTLSDGPAAQQMTFTRNANGWTETTVFNSPSASADPGLLVSHTNGRGVTTMVTAVSGGQIGELQRSFTVGTSPTVVESLLYTYTGTGSSALLQSVEYRKKVGAGGWTPLQQVVYDYYGASDPNGSVNDLKSASRQLANGSGGWDTVAVDYYRYWLAGSTVGFAHGLKMHFGPEGYRLMFNAGVNLATATDAAVMPYVDHYFEYDPSTWAVTKEVSAVCASCVGGGATTDLFSYSANPHSPAPGYNAWQTKTVQTLPDGSSKVIYTNYAAKPMLRVAVSAAGVVGAATFYRYDADGNAIWEAKPSAVALPASLSTIEAYDDLLNRSPGTGLYQYLNNTVGLIDVASFDAAGNMTSKAVRQGQSGTDVLTQAYTYTSNVDAAGNVVTPLASEVSYPDATSPSTTITTSYAYTWYSGTNQVHTVTTTPPVVGTGQNGPGVTTPAITILEEFDQNGNLTQRTDERGIVTTYAYDVVSTQVTTRVQNYQSGVTQPGVNVTTSYTYDDFARPTRTVGDAHTVVVGGVATSVQPVTWIVYKPSAMPGSGTWGTDQTWTGRGYASGAGPTYTLVDPVLIQKADKDGRATDQIASVRSSGSGALAPTDTFSQSDWKSWSSTQYDSQHRTLSMRQYFLIPSSGTGTAGTNYGQTTYGYDVLERRNRVVAPGGTITRTVYSSPKKVVSVWVGTDDTGATDSNPAGSGAPNNMVMVTSNVYGGGTAGGPGTLTQVTQYVSGTSGDTRVTHYDYDFRNRRISATGEVNVYEAYTYDNLDRLTQTDRRDTNASGNLIGRTQTLYDDRGRVYQTITYAVDPGTGTVGNTLTGNNWYDAGGNLIQQIAQGDGGVFTKTSYNGMGWVTATYRGYNTTGTSYSQAGSTSGDTIVSQSQSTYDEAGNVVSQARYERLNDATGTGALTAGTQPKARVSYIASWYDGTERMIATANYGAIASFTRPSTPPASSDTILVTLMAYDGAGRAYQVTDPKGVVNQTSFDAMGRVTQTVEDYGSGTLNRTTNTTYTLDGKVQTLTAVNAITGNQVTTYTYGSTLADSGVARNDLLRSVAYPDSTGSSDTVRYSYNRLGQQQTITDQRGTVRTYYRDKLGRLTNDCVTTLGGSTDGTVRQIATVYEVRGLIQTITSYDSATQNSGTVLNQVKLSYNSFGQLITDQQAHGGAVGSGTPQVGYGYDTGASGSNQIRPTTLTYPDARVLTRTYGLTHGMNDYLNRVNTLRESSFNIATYTYIGDGHVVRVDYPDIGVWLDLWGGTSGTFAGLDRFNRVIDQRWQLDTSPHTDLDRYQYGYDRDDNRLWKTAPVAAGAGKAFDELYDYDTLNRLTHLQRGTLNSFKTGLAPGSGTFEQQWSLDPTGNWGVFDQDDSGTGSFNLAQPRSHNAANEITNIAATSGVTWPTPSHDAAGNMTSMPQPASLTSAYTAVYDAWNRLVSLASGGHTVASYAYDGRNYRISKTEAPATSATHAYYSSGWQLLEERNSSGATTNQYTWGVRYVDDLAMRSDAVAATTLYALSDANFTVTALVDRNTGGVAERYLYTPYGSRTILSSAYVPLSGSAYGWTVGHQGLLHDVTGLVYNRVRQLHTQLGRFTGRDPQQYRDAMNLYGYEGESPLTRLDPQGTFWCELGCIAAIVALAATLTACFALIGSCAAGVLPSCVGALVACCGGIAGLLAIGNVCNCGSSSPPVPPAISALSKVIGAVCSVGSCAKGLAGLLAAVGATPPPTCDTCE